MCVCGGGGGGERQARVSMRLPSIHTGEVAIVLLVQCYRKREIAPAFWIVGKLGPTATVYLH